MGGIGRIFVKTYADAWRLLRDMWRTTLMTAVAAFAASFAGGFFTPFMTNQVGRAVLMVLVAIGSFWLSAPYMVAQYRFLLLGERNDWPRFLDRPRHVDLFFAWSGIITFVSALPPIVDAVTRPQGPVYYTGSTLPPLHDYVSLLIAILVVWIFATRLVTLQPGIAVGRPATLARALADTRGHFWFTVGALTLTLLPVGIGALLVFSLFRGNLGAIEPLRRPLAAAAAALSGLVATALGAALDARFAPMAGGPTSIPSA